MNRIRSGRDAVGPRGWPNPSRHLFTPTTLPRSVPLGPDCYSSGSVTVAERKILAGCPVEHERCWPTIWLSSLPNIVSGGGGGCRGRGRLFSARWGARRYCSLILCHSVWANQRICGAAGGQVVSSQAWKTPRVLSKKGRVDEEYALCDVTCVHLGSHFLFSGGVLVSRKQKRHTTTIVSPCVDGLCCIFVFSSWRTVASWAPPTRRTYERVWCPMETECRPETSRSPVRTRCQRCRTRRNLDSSSERLEQKERKTQTEETHRRQGLCPFKVKSWYKHRDEKDWNQD